MFSLSRFRAAVVSSSSPSRSPYLMDTTVAKASDWLSMVRRGVGGAEAGAGVPSAVVGEALLCVGEMDGEG